MGLVDYGSPNYYRGTRIVVGIDASPFGFGGWLQVNDVVVESFASTISKDDCEHLGFDMAKLGKNACCYEFDKNGPESEKPVIFVMDYAFGEQAYETIDELLKPYRIKKTFFQLLVLS